jgi:hypothetical protein
VGEVVERLLKDKEPRCGGMYGAPRALGRVWIVVRGRGVCKSTWKRGVDNSNSKRAEVTVTVPSWTPRRSGGVVATTSAPARIGPPPVLTIMKPPCPTVSSLPHSECPTVSP